MANVKISNLTAATTPLAGTEVLPIVQSGATVKASIANVQTATYSGGTANGVAYLNGSKVLTTGSVLTFDGAILGVNGISVGRGAGAVASNTAVGASALAANTTGLQNTALGWTAGQAFTTGAYSTAVGSRALQATTTGSNNTSVGAESLFSNTTASSNTAVGYQAGYSTTTGGTSTYIGYQAGYTNTTNDYNTYVGWQAGYTATGRNNTFVGIESGKLMTTGIKNTILGGFNGNQGGLDIRTASNYIVLSDGDGNWRCYFDNNGSFKVPQVYVDTTAAAANVNVGATGFLTRSTSALKYKQDVRDLEEMDINLLRAVRYKSKCAGDDQTKDHFGIVADEVDAAGIKELVSYGADGEVEGFQYERLTVVLLKAMQTLKAEVDSLKAQINGASA